MSRGRRWTKEEIEYLRDMYHYRRNSTLSRHLNRTEKAILQMASRLKLGRKDSWTDKQIAYLEKNYALKSNLEIGLAIGRSAMAVRKKVTALGLGCKNDFGEMVSLCQVYKALHGGCHPSARNKQQLLNTGIPTHTFYLSSQHPDKPTIMVQLDEFWEWLEQNPKAIKLAKLEENILGKEPQWAKEKRRREWLEKAKKRWKQ